MTAREIADLHAAFLELAKDKTEQLYFVSFPTCRPDVRREHPDQGRQLTHCTDLPG